MLRPFFCCQPLGWGAPPRPAAQQGGKLYASPPPGLACRESFVVPTPLPPSRAHTMEVFVTSQAREGDGFI